MSITERKNYHIKTMTREQVDVALDWAADEGWNPGLHDAEPFYTADPEGFFMGFLDREPLSSISAVRYGKGFGFIGFFMVKPEHRGKGYGFEMGQWALAHLEGRLIGIDGVVAQQENYQKAGFTLVHRNIRYEGVGSGEPVNHPEILPLSGIPFEEIYACDRRFFPGKRDAFLKSWIGRPHTVALGIRLQDHLAGYGVLRPCRSGYKIGPLFAPDAGWAETLLLSLLGHARKGSPVYLDVPEINPSAVALAEDNRMKMVFETARMYNHKPPNLPLNEIFGITTFELG
ncbi:MAG: GNAT family N-acetyltransferase [Deltaproteobacteria bacterium]|nr:GNAT family N-acetyltransferase [Deltaproteobacteria bacterium]